MLCVGGGWGKSHDSLGLIRSALDCLNPHPPIPSNQTILHFMLSIHLSTHLVSHPPFFPPFSAACFSRNLALDLLTPPKDGYACLCVRMTVCVYEMEKEGMSGRKRWKTIRGA